MDVEGLMEGEEVEMESVPVPEHIQKLMNEDTSSSSSDAGDSKSEEGGRSSEDWTELDKEGWETTG